MVTKTQFINFLAWGSSQDWEAPTNLKFEILEKELTNQNLEEIQKSTRLGRLKDRVKRVKNEYEVDSLFIVKPSETDDRYLKAAQSISKSLFALVLGSFCLEISCYFFRSKSVVMIPVLIANGGLCALAVFRKYQLGSAIKNFQIKLKNQNKVTANELAIKRQNYYPLIDNLPSNPNPEKSEKVLHHREGELFFKNKLLQSLTNFDEPNTFSQQSEYVSNFFISIGFLNNFLNLQEKFFFKVSPILSCYKNLKTILNSHEENKIQPQNHLNNRRLVIIQHVDRCIPKLKEIIDQTLDNSTNPNLQRSPYFDESNKRNFTISCYITTFSDSLKKEWNEIDEKEEIFKTNLCCLYERIKRMKDELISYLSNQNSTLSDPAESFKEAYHLPNPLPLNESSVRPLDRDWVSRFESLHNTQLSKPTFKNYFDIFKTKLNLN